MKARYEFSKASSKYTESIFIFINESIVIICWRWLFFLCRFRSLFVIPLLPLLLNFLLNLFQLLFGLLNLFLFLRFWLLNLFYRILQCWFCLTKYLFCSDRVINVTYFPYPNYPYCQYLGLDLFIEWVHFNYGCIFLDIPLHKP